jgi:hypothetical protein
MEDVEADDPIGSDSGGPIREANSATNKEDDNLIYDWEHFRNNKAQCRYDYYYNGCRIVVELGVDVADLDARAPRVRAVLDSQGWIDMVVNHCPVVEEIVREFYANLH